MQVTTTIKGWSLAGVLACASTLTLASTAVLAEGMPGRAPRAAPFSWTGYYWGANAGVDWVRSDRFSATPDAGTLAFFNTAPVDLLPPDQKPNSKAGVVGGLQAGYNLQLGSMPGLVVGWETDLQLTTAKATKTSSYLYANTANPVNQATVSAEARQEWFGTLRARLGVLVSPTLLAYVTGGLAYGEVQRDWSYSAQRPLGATPNRINSGVSTPLDIGWTAGGGVEWAMTNKMTLSVEYLYVTFDGKNFETSNFGAGCTAAVCKFSIRDGDVENHIARVKLNFKL